MLTLDKSILVRLVLLIFTSAYLVSCVRYLDVSWDFSLDNVYDGWAAATSDQMQMQTVVENGEFRGSIFGPQPNFASPPLMLYASSRHYVVAPMKYIGAADKGRLFLQAGVDFSTGRTNSDFMFTSWSENVTVTAMDSSTPSSSENAASAAVDGSLYTYFRANASGGIYLTFDLGAIRWVRSIRIVPLQEDGQSPRRCMLQRSVANGPGSFETVLSFSLLPNTDPDGNHTSRYVKVDAPEGMATATGEQTVSGFNEQSRYWRLIILDNYGAYHTGIREINFDTYSNAVAIVPFDLDNTGTLKTYYLPIFQYVNGPIVRMKFEFYESTKIKESGTKPAYRFKESLAIDFIRVAKAPEVWRVRGCLDVYYNSSDLSDPSFSVQSQVEDINGKLPIRFFQKLDDPYSKYATTYDCPVAGGVSVQIDGTNFGSNPRVFVSSRECIVSQVVLGDTLDTLVCILPSGNVGLNAIVRVQNGVLPGLFFEWPGIVYRQAPPVPNPPIITNVGAARIDLTWSPPGTPFNQLTVTGYKILWFQPQFPTRISNLTVGNVTTTSVRGLSPATEYVFAIAAMSEGVIPEGSADLPTDLYGRRDPTSSDAYIGGFSVYTNITGTLANDFQFSFFNANSTLNSSSSSTSQSLGPTGMFGGEGHYGLVIVGSANVANCNASVTCCDGYNSSIGAASCKSSSMVCAVLDQRMYQGMTILDGQVPRVIPTNIDFPDGSPPVINIFTLAELLQNKAANLPSAACGPSLRLTPSEARSTGAAWYRRKVNVREGFDTTFSFELSNPSFKCKYQDDVSTFCRSRGADGLAFVVQNVAPDALGNGGSGMGYEGLMNTLAVEFDTYMNYDQLDFYENHVGVMTQGFRFDVVANHSSSLATTTRVADLTRGRHTVRIRYDPNFDERAIQHPSFRVDGYGSWFLENADYIYGGEGDWGTGFGLLYVYVDDLHSPIITTPLNLDATLDLDDGRAWVGITAATGDGNWQTHDVLDWEFTSLFIDTAYTPPLVVNGEGAHDCVNQTACVHQVDYEHYMRTNNIWGRGFDNTVSWQDGAEGFCDTC